MSCKDCGYRYMFLEDMHDVESWKWGCRINQPEVEEDKGCEKKLSMDKDDWKK